MNWRYITIFILLAVILFGVGCTPGVTTGGSPVPDDDDAVVATPGGSVEEDDPNRPVTSDDPEPAATPTYEGEIIEGEAMVRSIDIAVMESFPVQVMVTAEGDLPDGCTTISHDEQSIDGHTITVQLYTSRPAELMCTLALVPFAHNVPLDVLGLPAGEYTVDVNGVTGTFNLAVDNTLQ